MLLVAQSSRTVLNFLEYDANGSAVAGFWQNGTVAVDDSNFHVGPDQGALFQPNGQFLVLGTEGTAAGIVAAIRRSKPAVKFFRIWRKMTKTGDQSCL